MDKPFQQASGFIEGSIQYAMACRWPSPETYPSHGDENSSQAAVPHRRCTSSGVALFGMNPLNVLQTFYRVGTALNCRRSFRSFAKIRESNLLCLLPTGHAKFWVLDGVMIGRGQGNIEVSSPSHITTSSPPVQRQPSRRLVSLFEMGQTSPFQVSVTTCSMQRQCKGCHSLGLDATASVMCPVPAMMLGQRSPWIDSNWTKSTSPGASES